MDIEFESQLRSIASGMDYPRTPNIAGSVATRLRSFPSTFGRLVPFRVGGRGEGRSRFALKRWAWSLTIVLVLLSSLMIVPTTRAAILEFIQIGIVRIFPQPVTPTPKIPMPSTATPSASLPLFISFLDDIAGETKLANAQEAASYPIKLPSHPADLGQPDHVYVQDADGAMTILVWVDPQESERVTLSLHMIPKGSWAIHKMGPQVIQETLVNSQRAVWAIGPYPLRMRNDNLDIVRLIEGHVLIWTEGDVTYRLETDLSLEEAIKIAESLEPIP